MELANSNANLKRALSVAFNTGDGHKMAMQVGAVMELAPHAPMAHMFHVMGTDAFLRINKFGERYENEDVDTQSIANQCLQQGGYWVVFDASRQKDVAGMGIGFRRLSSLVVPPAFPGIFLNFEGFAITSCVAYKHLFIP